MATVRLHFPENEAPTLLNLNGPRITVGRLPHNTIQIIDRTISALHAEFIREGDHYRLHDRGSINGTFVNGEPITDYHLKDACKISFGTFEVEFSPAIAPADLEASSEALPTRGEINEVRHENVKLRNQVELLRDEVKTLSSIGTGIAGPENGAVSKEEFVRVVTEMEHLKESLQSSGAEVKRLKSDLAVLQRDRANLQRALDSVKGEMPEREMRATPVELSRERISLDQDSEAPFETDLKPEENSDLPEAEISSSVEAPPPEAPAPVPFQNLPKPSVLPGKPLVPTSSKEPAATASPVPQPQPIAPAATAKIQPGTGSGVRPFPKSNPPAPQAKPGSPSGVPVAAPSSIRPPAPGIAKPFQKAVAKAPVATPAAAGPKGTQKIGVTPPEKA